MQYQSHSPQPSCREMTGRESQIPNGHLEHSPCRKVCASDAVQSVDNTAARPNDPRRQTARRVVPVCVCVRAPVCTCARRTVPPLKWPQRTENKSLRDLPHPVQLGQSMDLSMALKVVSTSPPTLRSRILSQFNLVCFEWSITYHGSKFKQAKSLRAYCARNDC